MAEEWKDIPGFVGYQVSSSGRVRSFRKRGFAAGAHMLRTKPATIGEKYRVLSEFVSRGYHIVTMSDSEMNKHKRNVAVLVADAFSKAEEGSSVQFRDGNIHNLSAGNVYWGFERAADPNECQPGEVWRDIPGFIGYQVSACGKVRTCRASGVRTGDARGAKRGIRLTSTWKPVTSNANNVRKYHCVCVRDETGTACTLLLSATILRAFVGPCPDGMWALHKDDNRNNNTLANLYWGTPQQNSDDAVRNGRIPRGERCHRAKLRDEDVNAIRQRIETGERNCDLANEYGVCQTTISDIKHFRQRKRMKAEV